MDFILKCCILVLIPLIPAVIIFKYFPDSIAIGQYTLDGATWKFGGAFGAYAFILITLLSFARPILFVADAEVWTVRGKINAENAPDIRNTLAIRSLPTGMDIERDGTYELQVMVKKIKGERDFPKLFFDLSRHCFKVKSVALGEDVGTFSALSVGSDIKVMKQDDRHLIQVSPINLERSDPQCEPPTGNRGAT